MYLVEALKVLLPSHSLVVWFFLLSCSAGPCKIRICAASFFAQKVCMWKDQNMLVGESTNNTVSVPKTSRKRLEGKHRMAVVETGSTPRTCKSRNISSALVHLFPGVSRAVVSRCETSEDVSPYGLLDMPKYEANGSHCLLMSPCFDIALLYWAVDSEVRHVIRRSFSLVITLPVWHWDNGWQMKLQRVFVRASNCTQTLVGQIQCDRSKWKICMAQDRACEDFESFPCLSMCSCLA